MQLYLYAPEEFAVFLCLHLQDSITVLGQVCCDSNGKLNAQSVLLEAGPEQGGQQVPVDLSELKEYSLFPGQVSRRTKKNYTRLCFERLFHCAALCRFCYVFCLCKTPAGGVL